MIDHVPCGISLEIGPHLRKDNVNEVEQAIFKFINTENSDNPVIQQQNSLDRKFCTKDNKTNRISCNVESSQDLEIFKVRGIIKKEKVNALLKNFEEIKAGQVIAYDNTGNQYAREDFIAVLVNEESYKEVLCLACKRIG